MQIELPAVYAVCWGLSRTMSAVSLRSVRVSEASTHKAGLLLPSSVECRIVRGWRAGPLLCHLKACMGLGDSPSAEGGYVGVGREGDLGGAIRGHGLLCCLQPLCCLEWWHMGWVGFLLIAECKSAPSVPRRDVRGLSPLSRYPWSGPHIAEPSYDSGKICTAGSPL